MPISKPVDDAKAAARQSYINQMREIMRDNGTDGSVTDYDGKLIITAEAFKLKPDRDRFMNLTFGPKYR